MRWLNDLLFRVRAVLFRRGMERDLDEEVAFHLEMETKKLIAEGLEPAEAHRRARVNFGGPERFKESAKESWGVTPLIDVWGDFRFAARQLWNRPVFTGLAALTLALGIGGTVAIFSVVNGLMLRALPVEDESALVTFWADYDWRGAEFDFVRERVRVFSGLAAYSDDASTLRTDGGSGLVLYSVGSAELFDVLGAPPVLGRTFRTGEDRPGAEPVIVLSHGLWQREFGGDAGVLGQRVNLGGSLRTVVGVMPRGFYFPSPESEAWVPLVLDPSENGYANNGWLVLVGRVRDDVTEEQVDQEMAQLGVSLGEEWDYPEAWDKTREPYVVPMRDFLLGDVRPALLLLLGGVGLVLLMACANVAALILTRTADRASEMGVRTALGAGRGRLARQILTESVLLGIVAGALGLGVAYLAFDALVGALPLPRELGQTLGLDYSVLLFSSGLAVLAGSLVSLAPMYNLLRGNLSTQAFRSRSASGTGRGGGGLHRGLVVAEVVLVVVLATGSALLIRTVGELRALDWGLDPDGVLTVDVLIPENETDPADRQLFYEALVERTAALPGIEAAGLMNRIPVRDRGWQGPVTLPDRPDLDDERRPNAYFRPVTAEAFSVLGIEVIEGRGIEPTDRADDALVAVVNETFARSMFPDGSAVGRFIGESGFTHEPTRIVGVIRNVSVDALVGDVPMTVYYAWAQTMAEADYAVLVAKTSLDPEAYVAPIRAMARQLDARAVLGRTESMEAVMNGAMAEPLRLRLFLGLFTLIGIVLGVTGVYGVVSYGVQRRASEFGIRMALGAAPRSLIGQVVRGGMVNVGTGVVLGVGAALAGSHLLADFLFGVAPTDIPSVAAAAALILAAGTCAALLPAWRASRTDPARALRAE